MPDLSNLPGMPDMSNVHLPPGQVMPTLAPGGAFILLTLPEAAGTHHSETRTPPACKTVLADEKYSYAKSNLSANTSVDPNDPDHMTGESVQQTEHGAATLKWDLRRGN